MKRKYYIFAIIIILMDQISKMLLIGKKITIIPYILNFTYTENTGLAYSIGNRNIAIILSTILILSIIYFIIKEKNKIKSYIPYILIISGSIGNLIDRIFRGYVIDFIDANIFNFPNFNIADICIVIGIIQLIISIVLLGQKRP